MMASPNKIVRLLLAASMLGGMALLAGCGSDPVVTRTEHTETSTTGPASPVAPAPGATTTTTTSHSEQTTP